jgi:hypothetical protein
MALITAQPKGFAQYRAKMQQYLERMSAEPDKAIIAFLRGEANELIADARRNGAYTDHTANLRSSIGCGIFFNGEMIEKFTADDATQQGRSAALTAITEWAQSNPAQIAEIGYTLVLVAGMNYGRYVEAKGYNVLHLSVVKAESDIAALRAKLRSTR